MKGCPLEYGRRQVRPIRALGSTRRQPEVAQAVMPTTANDQVVVDRDAKRGGCLGIPPISSREQAL